MERYFSRTGNTTSKPSSHEATEPRPSKRPKCAATQTTQLSKPSAPCKEIGIDLNSLKAYPGLRRKISQECEVAMGDQPEPMESDDRIALEAAIECIKFLISYGLILHGYGRSESSSNQGDYYDILSFHVRDRDNLYTVMWGENGMRPWGYVPKIRQLTTPEKERDIVRAMAAEITADIIGELGDGLFSIYVDEACDASGKEHLIITLRYVDEDGYIEERFLGISHLPDTKALTLKMGIESMLGKHGLSLSRIRAQSYNGNIKGEVNELKNLILAENPSAYYVHCSAHPLELTFVAIAKNHGDVSCFFTTVTRLISLVEAPNKGNDSAGGGQFAKVAEALFRADHRNGRQLNREIGLERNHDSPGRSLFETLLILDVMFSDVIDGLDIIRREGNSEAKGEAIAMLMLVQTFDFAFILKMMIEVLGNADILSRALQMKEQQIFNAMSLAHVAKIIFQRLRQEGWKPLLDKVLSFCKKHYLHILNMDDPYAPLGMPRRNIQQGTNLHHFQVELFYTVVDMQLQELNNQFDGVNTELLKCMGCLIPDKSFKDFNKQMVMKLATFYPSEFSDADIIPLENQLDAYIQDIQLDERFRGLEGIEALSRGMVATEKHMMYPLVYLLVKLALILPIAGRTSVERTSTRTTKYIKKELRDRIADDSMNDYLIADIGGGVVECFDNEGIIEYLQNNISN
ncbi:unnamed protein product [Linum trigynum]|uniref:DUF4371 domain-containing protein n=1 Tax=Linum trigynum TaxID=586398 RepID=A0AAV2D7R0_9ROSI